MTMQNSSEHVECDTTTSDVFVVDMQEKQSIHRRASLFYLHDHATGYILGISINEGEAIHEQDASSHVEQALSSLDQDSKNEGEAFNEHT